MPTHRYGVMIYKEEMRYSQVSGFLVCFSAFDSPTVLEPAEGSATLNIWVEGGITTAVPLLDLPGLLASGLNEMSGYLSLSRKLKIGSRSSPSFVSRQ